MIEEDSRNAFDKLVAGMSSEDRNAMLNRINHSNVRPVQIITPEVDSSQNYSPIAEKIQSESILYRFFLWLRALFSSSEKEQIYTQDLLANLAKRINRNHPGIVNHKLKVLDYLFYERLANLKEAADFFKPYYSFVKENPGDFYVFLSSLVAPQLSEKINLTADPFILPLTKEPSPDVRSELSRRLDEILKDMDGALKTSIYSAVQQSNWLEQFSSLPYIHFLAQFTNVAGDVYTCPYENAILDFNEMAKVFGNIIPLQNEVLEGLYLFSQRKNLNDNVQEKDIEKATKEFLMQANTYVSTMQEFISELSILKIGKILNNNYEWEPGNMDGAEAWFPNFRSQWRKIQDIRWKDWLREQKKAHLSQDLKTDFGLNEFPVMQYRPWLKLWTQVSFNCELTGGFLSWFYLNRYENIILPLNLITMEGVFIKSENRTEFSEGLNYFVTANTSVKDILIKLSPKGDYGKVFQDFADNRVHTLSVQNQIQAMMRDTENIIHEAIKQFGKGARIIERIFHGFFDEQKDGIHEGLQNINTIRGRENRQYREQLQEIRELLRKSLFYISELEPIDATIQ